MTVQETAEWVYFDTTVSGVLDAFRILFGCLDIVSAGDYEPLKPLSHFGVDPVSSLAELSLDGRMIILKSGNPRLVVMVHRNRAILGGLPCVSVVSQVKRKTHSGAIVRSLECFRPDFGIVRVEPAARTADEMSAPGRLVTLAPRSWFGIPDSAFEVAFAGGKHIANPDGLLTSQVFPSATLRRQRAASPEQYVDDYELAPATDLRLESLGYGPDSA